MAVQLTTTSLPFLEDSESVTITRYVQSGSDGLSRTATVIYSGSGDIQINTGDTYVDPGGITANADGVLVLDPIGGVLPTVKLGDIVTVNGIAYTVVLVQSWAFGIPHLEVMVRLGTRYQAAR